MGLRPTQEDEKHADQHDLFTSFRTRKLWVPHISRRRSAKPRDLQCLLWTSPILPESDPDEPFPPKSKSPAPHRKSEAWGRSSNSNQRRFFFLAAGFFFVGFLAAFFFSSPSSLLAAEGFSNRGKTGTNKDPSWSAARFRRELRRGVRLRLPSRPREHSTSSSCC